MVHEAYWVLPLLVCGSESCYLPGRMEPLESIVLTQWALDSF